MGLSENSENMEIITSSTTPITDFHKYIQAGYHIYRPDPRHPGDYYTPPKDFEPHPWGFKFDITTKSFVKRIQTKEEFLRDRISYKQLGSLVEQAQER